ncbi:hypothetical protein R4Z10_15725 [Niallia sp. XMNu-256]|uniref:hypothetical protein n=1 Tax=Niallia sp. XMNu-256 TaxID=3082444 RepID=UPI0030D3D698
MSRNEGYYLSELLISLSGWILVASILVPMMISLTKQTVEIQEKSEANHFLYEYVQKVVIEKPERTNFSVTKNSKEYDITWDDEKDELKSEVSIRYENVFGETVQFTETIQ